MYGDGDVDMDEQFVYDDDVITQEDCWVRRPLQPSLCCRLAS